MYVVALAVSYTHLDVYKRQRLQRPAGRLHQDADRRPPASLSARGGTEHRSEQLFVKRVALCSQVVFNLQAPNDEEGGA